jgi:hypothetical protein
MIRSVLLLSVLVGIGQSAFALSMNLQTDARDRLIYVNLWGKIEENDDARFRRMITPLLQSDYVLFRVTISSVGGDVEAAMGIARQIRVLRAHTRGPFISRSGRPECVFSQASGTDREAAPENPDGSGCTCASACFFIWAAGNKREGNYLGVHRFSYPNGRVSAARYSFDMRRMTDDLLRFDVPYSIIRRMFETDDDDMYFLTRGEIDLVTSTPGLSAHIEAQCGFVIKTQNRGRPVSDSGVWQSCQRGVLITQMRRGARLYLGW